jgi:glutamate-ammonia-ligase adenylyltransferase
VEFSVQLLQLVHGRSDVMLRSPSTLVALEALSTWGYVGREDGATLGAAYRFLRTLEHRIQLHELRRSHIVPEDEADLRRIGRSLGLRTDPVAELTAEWRRHAREVRRIHEKLFYRPLLQAVARLDPGDARLTPEAAEERMAALGYADPAGALRHLEALTSGVSRRAAIQRTLLPVLLGWFADGPDPDAALLGFRRMSDDLGSTPWYLRLLRDESLAAERMATILSSSRFATDLLLRSPDAVALLADDRELLPRSREALVTEAQAAVSRHEDPETAVGALRALRRRELFRIAACDVLGLIEEQDVMSALTDVTDATLIGTLAVAERSVIADRGSLPTRMALVAMGRFGGGELGYSSDADLIFVHDPLPDANEKDASDAAFAIANDIRRLLMTPSPDPALEIDADLRPEGRQGPLVRSLDSYRAYYERWSAPWEAQALIRARPFAGDADLCAAFTSLVDPLRWPPGGISDADTREMRRLKARMESERLPRGADPSTHLKQGRGGLADVEWVAQLLQLRHAALSDLPDLRTTSTLAALDAATEAGLLDAGDRDMLESSWLLATRVRNAIALTSGRPSDSVPTSGPVLAAVAHLLGYRQPADLLEEYRRTTRRARGVVERVFYG